jgi:7-keto-8-aminopelargonate synthetase-like enzyme
MIESLLREELAELQARDLYRKLRTLRPIDSTHAYLDSFPHPNPLPEGERRVRAQGKEILLFCGNDYLGLSHHPRVIEAAKEAIRRCGIGSGAARLISGTSELHTRLEEKLAAFKRKEKALVFTTGYLTNLGVLSSLAGKEDLIVMDKLCHASLIDGARLSGATLRVFPHKNYQKCEEILKQNFCNTPAPCLPAGKALSSLPKRERGRGKRILVTDSVFSMDGDLADLAELVRLKEKYDCLLVVDDAHGTGVLGLEGRGAAEDLRLENKIDCIVGTLSKALGCLGGFVAASSEMIDYFINTARSFIFATSLPPLLCAAALRAFEVIEEEPAIRYRLWQNIQKMHEGLQRAGFGNGDRLLFDEPSVKSNLAPFPASPIFPIGIGSEKEALQVSEKLLNQGILAPAVRYPSVPKGKARLRVTVSAAHQSEDIERLIRNLSQIKTNFAINKTGSP